MTINLTHPLGEVSAETAQRDGYMTALAAAEHIISTSPVIPTEMEQHCKPWAVEQLFLSFHFFDSPDSVCQFAEHFGLMPMKRVVDDGGTEMQAEGRVCGVQVRAWCRTAPAVTA